jgi:hypothetical protein
MRTKTLALTALLGMLGTASVMSQSVYSINAVGYINLTVPTGFSIISCQLQVSPNNQIGYVLNNDEGSSGNPGPIEGCEVFKYVPAHGNYSEDIADATDEDPSGNSGPDTNGWAGGGVLTMNPGEALWFKNVTGAPATLTFVGTVPQGTLNVTIGNGFNMISSPVPFTGGLSTVAGMTQFNDTDEVFAYNNATVNYTEYLVDEDDGPPTTGGYMNDWLLPNGEPSLTVGEGFWYNNTSGAPFVYSQVFSINP